MLTTVLTAAALHRLPQWPGSEYAPAQAAMSCLAAAPQHAGFADDYALLIAGLLDLYECGGGLQWLQWAVELQATLDSLFWDPAGG